MRSIVSGSRRPMSETQGDGWGGLDEEKVLLQKAMELVPSLKDASKRYKGQAGKIGVIGGCREYTGAPFFASYAALKVGADLSHVFCTNGAATVIKSYSPELIVHPYLPDSEDVPLSQPAMSDSQQKTLKEKAVRAICDWLYKFDVLVIGPGLGRDPLVLSTVEAVLLEARSRDIPLVIDADGLFLIKENPELVIGYSKVILTPNAPELQRLLTKLEIEVEDDMHRSRERRELVKELAKKMRGPLLVSKGGHDIISDGQSVYLCTTKGSPRRAGGQGDVMAGTIAAFVAWNYEDRHHMVTQNEHKNETDLSKIKNNYPPLLLAAYGGCSVTRQASALAFHEKGRAMGASDVMMSLGRTVDNLVEAM